jgi:hypothetical protein
MRPLPSEALDKEILPPPLVIAGALFVIEIYKKS